MFADLNGVSLPMRRRGIVVGLLLMIGVTAALAAPRTTPFTLAAAVVGLAAVALTGSHLRAAIPRISGHAFPLLMFLTFACASAAWAEEPVTTLTMTGAALLVTLGALALSHWFSEETLPNLVHIGEGVWLGYLLGLLYICIEIFTDQAIKVSLFNAIGLTAADLPHSERFTWVGERLTSISLEDLTRNIAPATLFLWPVALIVRRTLTRIPSAILTAAMFVACAIVVFISWHGTSKVALIVGLAFFSLACLSLEWTRRILAIGWTIASLAVLPLALLTYKLDLHNATWLGDSTRHRIIIWNFTAHQVAQAPIIGIGARSTYSLGPRTEQNIENLPNEHFPRTLSKHSHNIYLQTWLELGLVGAALLTWVGLSIVTAISRLDHSTQPFGFAAFAAAAAMAGSSYGMWQLWFVAMFAYAYILTAAGVYLPQARIKNLEQQAEL